MVTKTARKPVASPAKLNRMSESVKTMGETVQKVEKELNPKQKESQLVKYTDAIVNALKSFLVVCRNVRLIDKDDLYAVRGYDSLPKYCEAAFDFTSADTTRFRNAGKLIYTLESHGFTEAELPQNEGQCRVLNKVKKADLEGTWRKVLDTAKESGERISADMIRKVAGLPGPKVKDDNEPEAPAVNQKPITATVIVKTSEEAGVVMSHFDAANYHSPEDHKRGFRLSIGIDSTEELSKVLVDFDDHKINSLSIKLDRK